MIIGSRPAWKAGVPETGLGVRVPSSPQRKKSRSDFNAAVAFKLRSNLLRDAGIPFNVTDVFYVLLCLYTPKSKR